jgi:hypothetical protein
MAGIKIEVTYKILDFNSLTIKSLVNSKDIV